MSKFYARRRLSILAALTGMVASVGLLNGPTASAALPTPVSAATARTYLASLTVAAENRTGYSRDLFPTWDTISGTCNTREWILKRDGSNVTTNSSCYPTSGSWYSPYDGATWSSPSDVDIDHLVPLAEAWDSGASKWTTAHRQAFANDVTRPQLLAVTDNVNQSKSDQSPDAWKPPLSSYYCIYARMWVRVKYVWALTVTSAEKTALTSMLGTC